MLQIGPVRIAHPFTQAALSGFSDLPMRRIARRLGASYALTPVVLDRSVRHDGDWQRQFLRVPPDDHPVGAQLMGDDPGGIAEAARRLADAGYDVIDLNFACPAARILRRRHGGHLLCAPDLALEIVDAVLAAVAGRCPVTVKLRRGLDDTAESRKAFFDLLDGACARGVAGVTLHPRTVEQRYAGRADWNFLAEVRRRLEGLPLLGSGDLFAGRDALRLIAETGVDGVAFARGAIGNPWIFAEARALAAGNAPPGPPSLAEQRAVINRHFAETVACCGPERAGWLMRRHLLKYCKLHPRPRAVRAAVVAVRTTAEYLAVFERWYGGEQPAPPTAGQPPGGPADGLTP